MADRLDPDRDALAAELALGVLEGEDRAAALRLSLSDPAFAAAVEAWRVRLGPLYDEFAEAPAPDLWSAIDARLPAAEQGTSRQLRQLRLWRWAAIGSGALAASLAAVMVFTPSPKPVTIVREVVRTPDQVAVARLDGKAGAVIAANYAPDIGDLRVRAIAIPDSTLRPELWVIPADGVPRSLGLLDGRGVTRVTVPAKLRALLVDGATLAVTMEPGDGAPHSAPSSAPIAAGTISRI